MQSRAVSRLDGIDGLRGLAIALVVAYHCWLVYAVDFNTHVLGFTIPLDVLPKTGFLGVELFFALSGFCMFYPYAQAHFRGTPPPTWQTYAYRRAIKIVPSYLVALSVFTLMYGAGNGVNGSAAAAFFTHIAFIHPFFPQLFESVSGPLWTIGVEAQFYLIFPLLCARFVRRPAFTAGVVVLLAGGYRVAVDLLHLDVSMFWTNQVIAFLDIFAAGMLAAYVVAMYRYRLAHRMPARTATILSLATAAVGLYGLVLLSQSSAMNGGAGFFMWQAHWRLPIAGLLFVLVTTTTLALPEWQRIVANRAFTFLAVISYNLYLWHLEILVLSRRAEVALPLALLASLAVATLVTYLIERPLLNLNAKLPQPRTA